MCARECKICARVFFLHTQAFEERIWKRKSFFPLDFFNKKKKANEKSINLNYIFFIFLSKNAVVVNHTTMRIILKVVLNIYNNLLYKYSYIPKKKN